MTNFCIFDGAYCINPVRNPVERTQVSAEDVVSLRLKFYRRNEIEGLLLASGIIRAPDQRTGRRIVVGGFFAHVGAASGHGPAPFLTLAEAILWHADPARFDAFSKALWRVKLTVMRAVLP